MNVAKVRDSSIFVVDVGIFDILAWDSGLNLRELARFNRQTGKAYLMPVPIPYIFVDEVVGFLRERRPVEVAGVLLIIGDRFCRQFRVSEDFELVPVPVSEEEDAGLERLPPSLRSLLESNMSEVRIFRHDSNSICRCGQRHASGYTLASHENVPRLLVDAALSNSQYVSNFIADSIVIQKRHRRPDGKLCEGFAYSYPQNKIKCEKCGQELSI